MTQLDPALTPPGTPCSRCGTFAEELTEVSGSRLCGNCVNLVRRNVRLWPYGYVLGVGMLLNFTVAAVLLALNWRRLGEKKRERNMWAAFAIGTVAIVGIILFVDTPRIGCGVNLAATWFLAREYRPVWATLKAQGAPRANVILPVVFTVVAMVAILGLMVAGEELGLYTLPE